MRPKAISFRGGAPDPLGFGRSAWCHTAKGSDPIQLIMNLRSKIKDATKESGIPAGFLALHCGPTSIRMNSKAEAESKIRSSGKGRRWQLRAAAVHTVFSNTLHKAHSHRGHKEEVRDLAMEMKTVACRVRGTTLRTGA